jgi:BirA family biotin operon repressor/biotin-[acetyl-CoA-carboxylase] ligase
VIGDRTIFFDTLGSTNKYLLENWQILPSETVVWAKQQQNAYGRKKSFWSSNSGGLWFSVLFKPKKRPVNPWHYVRLYSLTVYDILKEYDIKAQIKWPNDVLVEDKKICGILSEAVYAGKNPEAIIVGVGINVNNSIPEELSGKATSLIEFTSKQANLSKLLSRINHIAYYRYYLKYLKDKSVSVITKKWINALNIKVGDSVEIIPVEGSPFYAEISSINPDYLEILDENYNVKNFFAGEISVRTKK